ncbi:MAG: hypothetical protein SFW09_05340 [Hyphomicrobiaceae bacterium]|nr:hypothetical protein [Hyphomicrobiaceae bacterium]
MKVEPTSSRAANSFGDRIVWAVFAGGLVVATAPVWGFWLLGFNPTLDELVALSLCIGGSR